MNGVTNYLYSLSRGDIEKAFDHAHPSLVASALAAQGVAPQLIAAILQESVILQCVAYFEGLELVINFNRCVRQGSKGSGQVFRALVLFIIAPMFQS